MVKIKPQPGFPLVTWVFSKLFQKMVFLSKYIRKRVKIKMTVENRTVVTREKFKLMKFSGNLK